MNVSGIQEFNNKYNEIMSRDIKEPEQTRRFEDIMSKNILEGNQIEGSNLIGELDRTQKIAKSGLTDVLLGRSDNVHQALINMEQAKLEMQYATTIRDKVVSGVNQMLNMQI